jgi:hypothetical protein
MANPEIWRTSFPFAHPGQVGRFEVFTEREKKLKTVWQSEQ